MAIESIGLIGAGIMGSGIALDLACRKFPVILKDIDEERLAHSRALIREEFRVAQLLRPDLKNISLDEVLGRIQWTLDNEKFSAVDLVIECVPEDMAIKENVFRELSGHCRLDCLVASNTSCIPITRMSAWIDQPERMAGLHFMNPVVLSKLVEVIRGRNTSEDTLARIRAFLKSIGKNAVVVRDSPGFVANRLSHLFMNEAAFLVQEGVASAKEIDLIFKQGYGHKMGPLETADLIGLDTVVQSLDVLQENFQNAKFCCCPLLKEMVAAGKLGKKSGRGFFEYNQ